jgi:hypothetical protein
MLLRLLATANVSSSPIFHSDDGGDMFDEMLVPTRATWHNIPEDHILHGYHRKNLKSYKF